MEVRKSNPANPAGRSHPTGAGAVAVGAALACAWLAAACASTPGPEDLYEKSDASIEAEHFLEGQTLAQRKRQMSRAQRDMRHFVSGLTSLRRHARGDDIELVETFLRAYLEGHVAGLLSDRGKGWNPELARRDADLLFKEAEIWIELGARDDLADLIARIEGRFADMGTLVIEYPIGVESTLDDALIDLHRIHFEL